jgi:nucleoside diphosphate kinase
MAKPHPKEELTFVIIKPDGVKRGLIGEIIHRIEKAGLKVIALEMDTPSRDQIDDHYPKDEAWMTRIGNKALEVYQKYGYDAVETLGTADPLEDWQDGTQLDFGLCKFRSSGEDGHPRHSCSRHGP